MTRPITLLSLLGLAVLTVAAAAGCRDSSRTDVAPAPATLAGRVTVGGSSTLLPLSRMMAESFHVAHAAVEVSVAETGTGDGFRKLCAGEVDIVGASRPINAAESAACASRSLKFIELPVAFDSLSVVVNASNTAVSCLTTRELKILWAPAAEGTIARWSQVRAGLPDQPMSLFGPGKDSGTFDYFTLAINGAERSSRHDYAQSEDDANLVRGIASNTNALGYFGYAYYLANKDALKLVAIDSGHGCVLPSAESVADGTYQPLSRPVFIYATTVAAARPEVKAFARHYVSPDHATAVQQIGYVPLPAAALLSISRRLDRGVTGSIFGEHGSVLGVTAEAFADDDHVKNALVR